MASDIVNVLTIDLEDYFMVSAFESVVRREDWDKYESRIERNTHRLLEILSEAKPHLSSPESGTPAPSTLHPAPYTLHPSFGVRATFFCLGWVAEHYPHLIKEIHQQGHEIASHSYDHQLVYNMTPEQFRKDVVTSKRILEDITGKEVIGYRAPSYSITEKSLWAFRILAEEGFRYDSSIFPIHHDRYGIPAAPRFPFLVNLNGSRGGGSSMPLDFERAIPWHRNGENSYNGHIVEYPISTVKVLGLNLPISGGGYMRLLPYGLISRGLAKINQDEKHPFVFYLHPWELDPEQPRMNNISVSSKFRHYTNLHGTADKLKRLLNDFSLSSMEHVIGLK